MLVDVVFVPDLVVDPVSGAVLDHGRTTYHPPAALADFVRVRDVTCRFPGCRRSATDAELDHTLAWAAGGATTADDLRALCLHHHLLKHQAGWRVTAHPDGGPTWTTPTGERHTHRPARPPPGPLAAGESGIAGRGGGTRRPGPAPVPGVRAGRERAQACGS